MKKILLCEDEPHLAYNLELNLKAEGYEVTVAHDGLEALNYVKSKGPFDLIILDIMVPEIDGFQVAKSIRSKDMRTGILILTARAADEDRIRGLELGVDDYITKPFHLQELLLKVKRATKRGEMFQKLEGGPSVPLMAVLRLGDYELNREQLILKTPNGDHQLTALEAKVLYEFMHNKDRILSREYLLEKVWGLNKNVETRTVDNFILRLRKIIEKDPAHPCVLESIRSKGYRFNSCT